MVNDSVPPIWVVSLHHSTRRRAIMREHLDALLQQDTVELLRLRTRFPPDWGVVLLQYLNGPISVWHRVAITPGRHLGRFVRPPFCTGGYLIRNWAARHLLDHTFPVSAPADHWE